MSLLRLLAGAIRAAFQVVRNLVKIARPVFRSTIEVIWGTAGTPAQRAVRRSLTDIANTLLGRWIPGEVVYG